MPLAVRSIRNTGHMRVAVLMKLDDDGYSTEELLDMMDRALQADFFNSGETILDVVILSEED